MAKHALFSASASKQWLNCPPSARLCAEESDRASPYAKEGSDAHALCEAKVLTALGAIDLYDGIYDIHTVKMTIFQPRRDNVSTFTLDKEELLKWADTVLAPTAALAFNGEGEFKAGDHCQFCKVKATCRKRAEYNLELAKYDFEMPANLEDTEIAAILSKADELVPSSTGWSSLSPYHLVSE